MGHQTRELRQIRSTNVGTEVAAASNQSDLVVESLIDVITSPKDLSSRHIGMLRRYVIDMRQVLREIYRVLKPGGRVVLVTGDCNLKSTFVANSKCIEVIASNLGLQVLSIRRRQLLENRRYLPPPGSLGVGKELGKRMREEVVLSFIKK